MSAAVQPNLIDQLRPVLSDDRIGTYLVAAGFDPNRALALYLWNVEIGEAFHMPIQAVEVALRNRIATALAVVYGPTWWVEPAFLASATRKSVDDIQIAIRRMQARNQVVTPGQLIATLSFGFWINVLHPRFNPVIWSSQLPVAFPDLAPGKTRDDIYKMASRILILRNRIDHHEPILKMDLSRLFADMMTLLGWISPIKKSWIRPKCRVQALLRQKP